MRSITFISRLFMTCCHTFSRRSHRPALKSRIGTGMLFLAGLLMASPAPAGSLPASAGPGLSDAARQWLAEHGIIRPAGMAECKSSSDCDKGEICCKLSALESFCADPDECPLARPAPITPRR